MTSGFLRGRKTARLNGALRKPCSRNKPKAQSPRSCQIASMVTHSVVSVQLGRDIIGWAVLVIWNACSPLIMSARSSKGERLWRIQDKVSHRLPDVHGNLSSPPCRHGLFADSTAPLFGLT
jgi:hypothetical protein